LAILSDLCFLHQSGWHTKQFLVWNTVWLHYLRDACPSHKLNLNSCNVVDIVAVLISDHGTRQLVCCQLQWFCWCTLHTSVVNMVKTNWKPYV
jgi:hypothetical protein